MLTITMTVLAAMAVCVNDPPARPTFSDEVAQAVEADRLMAIIERLEDFGTRHTLSDTTSATRGIGAARRWIRDELQAIADASGRDDIVVELMVHEQPARSRVPDPIEVVNVVMTIPGSLAESNDRVFVVLGHYDSRAAGTNDAESDAPGANDDGSGTALVMELARIFATTAPCDATTVFLLTAGEEQGLLGATWFARTAQDQNMNIVAALSNDIVGDPSGPDGRMDRDRIRVFSEALPRTIDEVGLNRIRQLGLENDSPSRQLARYVADIAARHETAVQPWLIYRTDRFLRGGDHSAFNNLGYAAVRFCEVAENYDRQHQNVREIDDKRYGDVAEYVDGAYLADVTALNGAVLATLANSPSAPDVTLVMSGLSSATTLRWEQVPQPDVAGYEIAVRDTTSPQWQEVIDVGNVLEYTIDRSKDNWFFGVRAYDKDGNRSLVSIPSVGRR
ncbi:MAG: M28 family peptidase [Phycisphaerales bacterium]